MRLSTLLFGAGVCLLALGSGVVYTSAPAYTTTIEADASDIQRLAATSTVSTDAEVIPYATLSAAEQMAFTEARTDPSGRYWDRGASDSGPNFHYRNDLSNQYVVSYADAVYLIRVVVAINYVELFVGLASVGISLIGLTGGYWRRRHAA